MSARLVLLAGALAYLVAALVFVSAGTRRDRSAFAAGSAFNDSGHGLSLAYRYLGSRARPLTRPLDRDATEPGAVVLRARACGARLTLLTPAEQVWVMEGGRLVLAFGEPCRFLAAAGADSASPAAKVFPVWPGVTRFEPGKARPLGAGLPPGTRTLLARGREALASVWRHGRGEVVFLSGPQMLENDGLARAHHLRLLEALVAGRSAVYFDEHLHGLREDKDALDLLMDWGFGPALALAALVGALAFWRAKARVGPPDLDRREAPADAVDLLDSLARLYDRALGARDSLTLYHQHLARAVAQETGLRGEALAARVRDVAGREAEAPVFARALQALNDGYRRLKRAQAR